MRRRSLEAHGCLILTFVVEGFVAGLYGWGWGTDCLVVLGTVVAWAWFIR